MKPKYTLLRHWKWPIKLLVLIPVMLIFRLFTLMNLRLLHPIQQTIAEVFGRLLYWVKRLFSNPIKKADFEKNASKTYFLPLVYWNKPDFSALGTLFKGIFCLLLMELLAGTRPAYAQTQWAYNAATYNPSTTDTDGDGKMDNVDIDDDNDGILDAIECPQYTGTNPHFKSADFMKNGVSMPEDAPYNGIIDGNLSNWGYPAGSNGAWASGFVIDSVILVFKAPFTANGVTLTLYNDAATIPNGEGWQTITGIKVYDINNSVIYSSGAFDFGPVGDAANLYPFNLGNLTNAERVVFYGVTHRLGIADWAIREWAVSPAGTFTPYCPDTDSDGIPNYLDLDSDGDGCSDAYEAGATYDKTAYFSFTNVGTNGLANSLETVADNGIVNYYLNYSLVTNAVVDKCTLPFFPATTGGNDGYVTDGIVKGSTTPNNCGAYGFFSKTAIIDKGGFGGTNNPGNYNNQLPTGISANYQTFLGDLNNDGKLDLLWVTDAGAAAAQSGTAVWLGNGDGTFNHTPISDKGSFTGTVTFANNCIQAGVSSNESTYLVDANGDGKLDLLWITDAGGAAASSGTWVWAGNGDGTFNHTPIVDKGGFLGTDIIGGNNIIQAGYSDQEATHIADVNGDGKVDVVTIYSGFCVAGASKTWVWLGNGDGTWQHTPMLASGYSGPSICGNNIDTGVNAAESSLMADFNNDGKMDIIFIYDAGGAAANSGTSVWTGNGDGTFSKTPISQTGIYKGDISDGGTNIIQAGYSFREATRAVDVDGDGNLDIVWIYDGSVSSGINSGVWVWRGNGDGTFETTPIVERGVFTGSIPVVPNSVGAGYSAAENTMMGDLNGDGKIDILWTYNDQGANSGTYTWLAANCTPPTVFPGGVSPNLALWMRADKDLTTGATMTWLDQSGYDRNATQSTAASQPTFTGNAINFNPGLTFPDNSNNFLTVSAPALPTGNISYSIFSVAKATLLTGAFTGYNYIYVEGNDAGNQRVSVGRQNATMTQANYTNDLNAGAITTNVPYLLRYTRNSTNGTRVNGLNGVQVGTDVNTGLNKVNISGYPRIGNTTAGAGQESWDGDISEVIIYNDVLSATQVQQVESYLAIKYGITLNQTPATNYLSGDGSVVWNASANSGYKVNIAGIGQDDISGLAQKQSKSVNAGSLVTIGLGTIATDNATNSNTFAADKNFLIWGDNGGAAAWQSTESPANRQRLTREWKVQETGAVGSVKIQIPDNSSVLAAKLPAELTKVYLLTDADGDFSSGATETGMTLVGTNWEADIDLANGQFFTFATQTPAGSFTFGNCTNAAVSGTFTANGTGGQTGTLTIPITGATAGLVSISLTAIDFTTSPAPFEVTLTAGQTSIAVPITYSGAGAAGIRTLTVTSVQATGSCSPTVTVIAVLDTDGDGSPDATDTDDDDDGILDTQDPKPLDTDNDGTPNATDTDDDGDGILDSAEQSGKVLDTDNDGTPNATDTDDDNDGILDTAEQGTLVGGVYSLPDSDGDGLPDLADALDTDGDGIADNVDTDDDGDGLTDTTDPKPLDTDNDGTPNVTDTDDDGDGILDTAEAPGKALDTDNDGTPNATDTDDDNDGILDSTEIGVLDGTGKYTLPDGDGDGLPDLADALDLDVDNDGIPNATDPDMDGDGINNIYDTDVDGDGIPNATDTDDDGDGILDGADTAQPNDADGFGTPGNNDGDATPDASDFDLDGDGTANDVDLDTDNDGIPNATDTDDDGDGILDGADSTPQGPVATDTDGDGTPDATDTDDDNDGLSDTTDKFPLDTDNDGSNNDVDTDDDGDGILDTAEAPGKALDTDNDGTPNATDTDDDNDGILDTVEQGTLVGGVYSLPDSDGDGLPDLADALDTDGDGIADNVDTDDDGDGLTDTTDPKPLDTDNDGTPNATDTDDDGDGILDTAEAPGKALDTDNDGTPNATDTDDDNDGLLDTVEQGTLVGGVYSLPDSDGDGLPDLADALDTDGDGIADNVDTDDDGDGIPDVTDANPLDTDNDGIPNATDPDDDGDGMLDTQDPKLLDTDNDGQKNDVDTDDDGDGILDAAEQPGKGLDSDNDGTGNETDTDDDGDGIPDSTEQGTLVGGVYSLPDSDGDGLPDLADGVNDSLDTDGDGTPNSTDTDDDNDGLSDATDKFPLDTDNDGSNNDVDTDDDGDGILDANEQPGKALDSDNDGTPNATDTDDDNDGILDTAEIGVLDGTGKYTLPDSDGDGLPDLADALDTDGDGIADNVDTDDDGDGLTDTADPKPLDTDNDGTPNATDTDDDGDGILDTAEAPGKALDTDNDGTPNATDTDDDNDGILDSAEIGVLDGTGKYTLPDSDGDGLPDLADALDTDGDGTPDATDTDDDNDGIPDSVEGTADTDGDGVPDNKDADSDNDGINDVIEAGGTDANGDGKLDGTPNATTGQIGAGLTPPNSDNDAIPDYKDLDSDNDAVSDLQESGSNGTDADNDGVVDGPDTDGDGIPNSVDGLVGPGDAGSPALPNGDNDALPDYRDPDSDNDGTNDIVEKANKGTLDADNDGKVDSPTDPDGDGIPNNGGLDTKPAAFGGLPIATGPAAVDLFPNFTFGGSSFTLNATKTVVINVNEIKGAATSGTIQVFVPVATGFTFNFNGTATSVTVIGTETVNNADWTVTSTPTGLLFSTKAGVSIPANGRSRIAIAITANTAGTDGTVTANITPLVGETNAYNNIAVVGISIQN